MNEETAKHSMGRTVQDCEIMNDVPITRESDDSEISRPSVQRSVRSQDRLARKELPPLECATNLVSLTPAARLVECAGCWLCLWPVATHLPSPKISRAGGPC
jgi:hypothetical protein